MITGTLISYYLTCKRRCYLHAHNIKCEDNSELVKIGKYLHEERAAKLDDYKKGRSEIILDSIKIDSIEDQHVIEYKKKNSSEKASRAQLSYYLYVLKQKGIIKKGLLKFKETKKDIEVLLTPQNEKSIENLITKIEELIASNYTPSVINEPICKRCSYYDYCYS